MADRSGKVITMVFAGATLCTGATAGEAKTLLSPDGRTEMTLGISDGQPHCRVAHRGGPVLGPSRLGLRLSDGSVLGKGCAILGSSATEHDTTWQPVYGERSQVQDHYRELAVQLQQSGPVPRWELVFRCYDAGVAFAYRIPKGTGDGGLGIEAELTSFRFLDDHLCWVTRSAQGAYEALPISRMGEQAERPLTVQVADDRYVALGEARLVDFARMKLAGDNNAAHTIVSQLSGSVTAPLPLQTPWRVIMVAESPGRLLENNDLMLNLNDPCAIEDTNWIKPGKVIREVTLTTNDARRCVDFAAAHNIEYVEFDAGWYGHEYDDDADATSVSVDPKRSKGPLDLPHIVRYAEERGVGILLYVNRRALERQLDEILPLYRSWGIKGVKYGFVNVGSQKWTSWLHEAVRKAADHQLMVDIHDEYRPTGYSRTYPNLMTQEGIRGDEARPPTEQTLTILFSRMLAGAADNTVCYYNNRVDELWSHGYQLAKAVCFYSPWQFLYWYDRPGGPGELGEGRIGDEPELAFYDSLPTVWDDTRVIHGAIGQYAALARRAGEEWFIGCMNAGTPRELDVPLDFLPERATYTARVFRDDPTVKTRTRVRLDTRQVDAETVLRVSLPANGGQVMHLVQRAK